MTTGSFLKWVIISFIFMRFTFDSRMILNGEIRGQLLLEGKGLLQMINHTLYGFCGAEKRSVLDGILIISRTYIVICVLFFIPRGRISELISYWEYLGIDQTSLGKKYVDVIKQVENGG